LILTLSMDGGYQGGEWQSGVNRITFREPLSSEYGTHMTVKARLWPGISDESPETSELFPIWP